VKPNRGLKAVRKFRVPMSDIMPFQMSQDKLLKLFGVSSRIELLNMQLTPRRPIRSALNNLPVIEADDAKHQSFSFETTRL
jgi:hypothetical protein